MLNSLWMLVFLSATSALQNQYNSQLRPRVRHETRNASMNPDRRSCDVETRLMNLERQVSEKSENLRLELKEGGRRLQSLEWQSAEVQTALERFRNELDQFTNRPYSGVPSKLELQVDNLAKGIQLVVVALKSINSDIGAIKRNMSTVVRDTRSLRENRNDLHNSLAGQQLSRASPPRNCKEVQERGNSVSGIYRIQPELAPRAFMVLCDMNTRGGGWTYIHNRYEGVQDFYLNWDSYKLGFGNLGGEFWLGLEYLHQLTGYEVNELLIELVDLDMMRTYAHYAAFSVGDEQEGYALKVLGGYQGTAGDSLMYHAGSKFSTKDKDQDEWDEGSCAKAHFGGWWYKNCDKSNLNGKYLKGNVPEENLYQGMYWGGFHGAQYSLLQVRMMVRPRDENSRSLFPEVQ